jgi:hypothetical protein
MERFDARGLLGELGVLVAITSTPPRSPELRRLWFVQDVREASWEAEARHDHDASSTCSESEDLSSTLSESEDEGLLLMSARDRGS